MDRHTVMSQSVSVASFSTSEPAGATPPSGTAAAADHSNGYAPIRGQQRDLPPNAVVASSAPHPSSLDAAAATHCLIEDCGERAVELGYCPRHLRGYRRLCRDLFGPGA